MTCIEDELLARAYEYTIDTKDVHEIAWSLQDLHSKEFAREWIKEHLARFN